MKLPKPSRTENAKLRFQRVSCFIAIAVISLGTSTGCGSNRPSLKKVSGQVLIDGKPLTTGSVRLAPANMRPAYGNLDSDGRFTLTTYEIGDGAAYGTHPVAVSAFNIIGPDDRQIRQWFVPLKYGDPKTSGLNATIDDDTENLVLELTWGQEKGPVNEPLY